MNETSIKDKYSFLVSVILHQSAGEGMVPYSFLSTNSTRSQRIRHLFATLHVKCPQRIFNRISRIYQSATRWDQPNYWITIWVINDGILIYVCWLQEFSYTFFDTVTWHRKGFELASIITFAMQVNSQSKWDIHTTLTFLVD